MNVTSVVGEGSVFTFILPAPVLPAALPLVAGARLGRQPANAG